MNINMSNINIRFILEKNPKKRFNISDLIKLN